jgi:2-polyprenyl-3-methyl-5-hydroxy-6-metoxy-1,4-benzoquinol methylase
MHSPEKLSDLYAGQSLAVMDLGCAGGGFVKNINDAGHLGVGLEGSDYSMRRKRAEWATIPDRLFICDCTKPFVVSFEDTAKSVPISIDVVTAWAFLENIKVDDLAAVFRNIADHLNPNTGLFIASVHLRGCVIDGHQYHATVRPEWWWRDEFRKNGFFIIDRALNYFEDDWVRGSKNRQNGIRNLPHRREPSS